jgi:hypothetical protein
MLYSVGQANPKRVRPLRLPNIFNVCAKLSAFLCTDFQSVRLATLNQGLNVAFVGVVPKGRTIPLPSVEHREIHPLTG